MKRYSWFGMVLCLSVSVFSLSSCLPKPPLHRYGALRLAILPAEQMSSKAQAAEIRFINVKLVHKDDQLVKEEQFEYASGHQEFTFNGLYPGLWRITVSGINNSGKIIFTGTGESLVEPGQTTNIQLKLSPAPGTLKAGCDISRDQALAQQTKGTLYVYLNTDTAQTKYFSMTREGNWLKAEAVLPEGTYQAKIAVPNVTNAIFISPYYLVNIRAGEETTFNIIATSAISIIGFVDSTPETPTGLTAAYNRGDGTIRITWEEGTEPDLEGYHLYRTNNEGRFIRLTVNNSTNVSPPVTDTVAPGDFYNNRIGYAVSSFDRGGNESFWSEIVYVYK
ncbi:MAG: hypothetical protein K6U80_07895 [Firmicutes bacterium]|nr:hypothetical protein [Bacillota bacterium]